MAHIRTRGIVERTFGVLKTRFRCLDTTGGRLLYSPDLVCKVIVAFYVLHNIWVCTNAPWIPVPEVPDDDLNDEAGGPHPTAAAARMARRNAIIENYFS